MSGSSVSAAAHREQVATFGPDEGLVGILTLPRSPAATRIPVLILSAGVLHKVGPSRVGVELARFLADQGHPVLRFDLSGIGDSQAWPGGSLEETVVGDMVRAVDALLDAAGGERVAVVGFCSGADNAMHLARADRRVRSVTTFDPTVHPTRGFRIRRALGRISSLRSWLNLLTGRSLWLRFRRMVSTETRPPGFDRLLVPGPEELDELVGELRDSGVRILYVMSGAAEDYCNSPAQIRESLPNGFSEEHLRVEWRPDLDHILSAPGQRRAFCEIVGAWLGESHPREED